MREFDDLVEGIRFGLEHYYKQPYEFKCDGKVYHTERADRYWACKLCSGLYYELFDETPENCGDTIENEDE